MNPLESSMSGSYDPYLVVLSVTIAIFAAYTALDLAGQISSSKRYTKIGWLISGALAMGTGIWSMHFIGMLAFGLAVPVSYDSLGVIISMVIAIMISGIALLIVSRDLLGITELLIGSLLMGLGIIGMHYTGMAAMRFPGSIHYNYLLVGLSGLIAIAVSGIALWLVFHLQEVKSKITARYLKLGGAVIMGLAIPLTHYTGMLAASFYASNQIIKDNSSLETSILSAITSTVTFAILGVALLISLEKKVIERTAALVKLEVEIVERKHTEQQLRERSVQLEETLANLKRTQSQLVQTEKISSLGLLIAGIAHEVNNPISFIAGNLTYAQEYVDDLVKHLYLYQENYPTATEAIQNHAKEIELEYLLEDLPKTISSMKLGADRIEQIMRSLRSYSRADNNAKESADIHECLETTLMILQHRLKPNSERPEIQIIKEYGDLPKIECYAGQLNQVFMNLLANAIDALEESNIGKTFSEIQQQPNSIMIRTEITNQETPLVNIHIQDNGCGMSETVQEQMFEDFFTTKPKGKGTGIGLAISYQIITEKHHGKIKCLSSPGCGTEFIIQIPVVD
jgi:NO-binding membrane sensor protein with MHYT domain